MKKIILSLFILTLLLPNFSFAQGVPLSINNLNIESLGSAVNVSFDLRNNKSSFVDKLEYKVQFFKGDELETRGNIFSNLEYIYTERGSLESLNPSETKNVNFELKVPNTINPGKYFARVLVENNTGDSFGINYTSNPFELDGSGDFIGTINAYVKSTYGLSSLLQGQRVSGDEKISINIPEDENTDFFSYLESQSKVYSTVKIYSLSETNKLIHEGERKEVVKEDDSVNIEIPNDDGKNPGAYDVRVELTNENGEKVGREIVARWFVDGFSARIVSLETNTNWYNRNDNVDLKVNISSGGHSENDEIIVKSTFFFKDKGDVMFTKKHNLKSTDGKVEQVLIDFSDEEMNKKGYVERIEVEILDKDGKELAKTEIKLDTNKVFGKEEKEDNIISLVSTVLVLIGIIVALAVIRKLRPDLGGDKLDPSTLVAILILSASLIVSGLIISPENSTAQETNNTVWDNVDMYIWAATNSGEFPTNTIDTPFSCSQEQVVPIYVKSTCSHCNNAMDVDISFFDNYTSQNFGQAPSSIDIDIKDDTVKVHDPKNLLTGDSRFYITHTTGDSMIHGPFVYGFNVDPGDDGGVIKQKYRIWAKTISDSNDAGASYCYESQKIITRDLYCNNIKDICSNLDGVQENVPEHHRASPDGNGAYICKPMYDSQPIVATCVGDSGDIEIGDNATLGIATADKDITYSIVSHNLDSTPTLKKYEGPAKEGAVVDFKATKAKNYSVTFKATKGAQSMNKTCSVNSMNTTGNITQKLYCGTKKIDYYRGETNDGKDYLTIDWNWYFASRYEDDEARRNSGNAERDIKSVKWKILNDKNGLTPLNSGSSTFDFTLHDIDGRKVNPDTYDKAYAVGRTSAVGLHVVNVEVERISEPGKIFRTDCSAYVDPTIFMKSNSPSISCSGVPNPLSNGENSIKWNVNVVNQGNGGLNYKWDPTYSSGASGTDPSVITTHSNSGVVSSRVTATDSKGFTSSAICNVEIEESESEDLCTNLANVQKTMPDGYEDGDGDKLCTKSRRAPEVSCSGSPNPLKIGDSNKITWTATVIEEEGKNYTYAWSGSSGAKGGSKTTSTTHTNSDNGVVVSEIKVKDQTGLEGSSKCQVRVNADLCTNIPNHQSTMPSGYEDPEGDYTCTEAKAANSCKNPTDEVDACGVCCPVGKQWDGAKCSACPGGICPSSCTLGRTNFEVKEF